MATFKAMRSAVVLAEATLSDLERAAETTVATINQFRLTEEQFIDVAGKTEGLGLGDAGFDIAGPPLRIGKFFICSHYRLGIFR